MTPEQLSVEELAELRGWLASPFHGREDDVSSHMADRLLATLTAKDEIIAGLRTERDEAHGEAVLLETVLTEVRNICGQHEMVYGTMIDRIVGLTERALTPSDQGGRT